jgi:hypothetical protein
MGAKVLEGEDRDVATGSMAQMAEKRLSLPPDSQDGLRNLSPESCSGARNVKITPGGRPDISGHSAAIGRHILRLRHGTGGPAQQTTTQTYVQKEYTAAPT